MHAFIGGRTLATLIAIATATIVLTGCAASTTYSDLTGAAEPSDLPPDAVLSAGAVDAESARLVGEYEGTQIWLSWGATEETVCVAVSTIDNIVDVACGAVGTELRAREGTSVSYWAIPDGGSAPDGGHIRLSDNVYITAK